MWGDRYQTNGFEYYSQGFYSPVGAGENIIHYGYVDNFDWRNRHKANDPNSPYFDGDTVCHTGWITKPVCQEGCWTGTEMLCNVASNQCNGVIRTSPLCWIFGAVAHVEALVNLYYNQHIDDDLSEEYIACKLNLFIRGEPEWALSLIQSEGVPDEACRPFSASLDYCNDICSSNEEVDRIQIQNFHKYENSSDENIRDYLINYGPLSAAYFNMIGHTLYHAMLLVGWDVIDEDDILPIAGIDPSALSQYLGFTYWIYKQSEGPGANDHGFCYMLHWNDKQPNVYPIDPLITSKNRTDTDIKCYDKDGDGYYFWGIGPKPAHCPSCPDQRDGDDSDPGLGPMDANGFCTVINTYNASFEKNWNNWKQVGYDDFDWWRHQGTTQWGLTGPNGAQDGDYYIYTETSCRNCAGGKEFIIESPPIDLSAFCEAQIEFYYCQNTFYWGNECNTILALQKTENGGGYWGFPLWYVRNDQGEEWHKVTVRFPSHIKKLRFLVQSGNNYWCDVALDNITIGPALPDKDTVIIADQVWNTNQKVYSDIIIESGVTLTISNCTISMFEQRKIIVKPGAKLILNGATLTSTCNFMWQGIEVWGDYHEPQYTINGQCAQGTVIINNSLIENANNIALWHPGDYYSSGGIIKATGSTFKNNRRSAEFISYHNFNPNPPSHPQTSNLSYFTDCSFITDNSFLPNGKFYAHISMWDVEGVKINGCSFSNAKNYASSINRGYGIYTINAGYRVGSYCSSSTSPCPSGNLIRSSFQGLYAGIYALSSGSPNTVYVTHADFTDNSYGVRLSAVNNATVIQSAFDIGTNSICPNFTGIGLEMNNCTGYVIEQNTFTHTTLGNPGDEYLGIRVIGQILESEVVYNQIYNNSFQGVTVANQAEGVNLNQYNNTGLYYTCNENSDNVYDFYTTDVGIAKFQGTHSEPAGNTFSKHTIPLYSDFNNQAQYTVNYRYYNGDTYQHPENVYNVITGSAPHVNGCPDHFGNNGGAIDKLTREQIDALRQEYSDNTTAYNNKLALFESLEDGGNPSELAAEIAACTPYDTAVLHSELLTISPFLSGEILRAVADRSDVFSTSTLFEILAANPDELRNEAFLTYLAEKENPLPEYMIERLRIIAADSTDKTALQSELSYFQAGRFSALYPLIHDVLSDTVTDFSTFRNLMEVQQSLSADYQIIDSRMHEKNDSSALALLEIIPRTYSLDSAAMVEYNYYKDLKMFQLELVNDRINIFELDSAKIAFLEDIAANSSGIAGDQAKSILAFGYDIPVIDCSHAIESPVKSKAVNPSGNLNKTYEPRVSVAPNPSDDFTVFTYKLVAGVENSMIKIIDMKNQLIKVLPISSPEGFITLDTREMPSGVYVYIVGNDKFIKSGKLTVVH